MLELYVVRSEGEEREPVSFEQWNEEFDRGVVPILGARLGNFYICYDRIVKRYTGKPVRAEVLA